MTCALFFLSHRKSSDALACKGGKGVKIKLADCACRAALIAKQGKKVLRCPQAGCHGWRSFDASVLPLTQQHRPWCHVCELRSNIEKWTCIKCGMFQAHCICKTPETPKTRSTHKRSTDVPESQVMPKSKRAPT